ncbi:MAG TPA: carboxylating nicotinate-nucleotide diphosphorylase [Nitrospiria bacterium]|nr:carboxylating nicotinate-nucleotide diphosphorylase [Nitrospiria bacterium]
MTARITLAPSSLHTLIVAALAEDAIRRDVTTRRLFPRPVKARGVIIAKQPAIIAGLPAARAVFQAVDPLLRFRASARDGARIEAGAIVATLAGDGRSILAGERVALNFLQHLSGVATLTRRFVDAVEGTRAVILDTRKTIPGLRLLEKYAVRKGGGRNHRMDLSDGVLIKDNHLALADDLHSAVQAARRRAGRTRRQPIEVEVATLEEVREALTAGADIILLDNMPVVQIKEAVRLIGGRAKTEVSGGVHLHNVRDIAATGVDAISIGALTHSAPAADLSLEIKAGRRGRSV